MGSTWKKHQHKYNRLCTVHSSLETQNPWSSTRCITHYSKGFHYFPLIKWINKCWWSLKTLSRRIWKMSYSVLSNKVRGEREKNTSLFSFHCCKLSFAACLHFNKDQAEKWHWANVITVIPEIKSPEVRFVTSVFAPGLSKGWEVNESTLTWTWHNNQS